MTAVARPVVAVVQHQEDCPLGLFAGWLAAAGVDARVHRPDRGDPLPAAGDAAGLVVLGGSMSATDDATVPWLAGTRELLAAAVDDEVPTLAVCLGHQLLTVACGGRVEANPAGKQMGPLPVGLRPEAAADRLLGGVAAGARAIQWNNDVAVDLPPGAVLLAATADGIPQAIRVGPRAWGVQFHPEADGDIVARWMAADPQPPGAGAALAAIRRAEPAMARTWQKVVAAFCRLLGPDPAPTVNLTERGF